MKVTITGQQISLGQALQEYAEENLTKVVTKYLPHAVEAHVTFAKQNSFFVCQIVVHDGTGHGHVLKANRNSGDAHSAFDNSLAAIERQLRHYKNKLNDRHKKKLAHNEIKENSLSATKYVIEPDYEEEKEAESSDNPIIIAEKTTYIQTLTVSEAVMQMDLEELPALLFKNASTGKINVVYHRYDGNISWVAPE